MNRQNTLIDKLISCITVVMFLFNCVGQDIAGAAEIYPASPVSVDAVTIPLSLGEIECAHSGAKGKTIILIREAHCDYTCQKSIYGIIDHLKRLYGISLVLLEGGAGDYDLSPYIGKRVIPASSDVTDLTARVTDYFMREGRLSGAEAYAINSRGAVRLKGLEDADLYRLNLDVYRRNLKVKEDALGLVEALESALADLRDKIYSPELRALDAGIRSYASGEASIGQHICCLWSVLAERPDRAESYPNTAVLMNVIRSEGGIDFKKANVDRQSIVDAMMKRMSAVEAENLIAMTLSLERKDVRESEFYGYLIRKALSAGIDVDDLFPDIRAYAEYVREYEKIDSAALMEEVARIEKEISESLFENPEQRELYRLSRALKTLRDIFNLSVTPSEYASYVSGSQNSRADAFQDFIDRTCPDMELPAGLELLDTYARGARRFYETARERDGAFIENIENHIWKDPAAVVVTGGFHAGKLERILKERGYSILSVLPKVSRGDNGLYHRLLAGGKSGAEEIVERVTAPAVGAEYASRRVPAAVRRVWHRMLSVMGMAVASMLSEMRVEGSELFGNTWRVVSGLQTRGRASLRVRGGYVIFSTKPLGPLSTEAGVLDGRPVYSTMTRTDIRPDTCLESSGSPGPMGGGLNAYQLAEFAASGTPEELAGYFSGEPGLFAEQVGIVRDGLRKRGGTFLSRFDELVAPVRESAEARRERLSRAVLADNKRLKKLGFGRRKGPLKKKAAEYKRWLSTEVEKDLMEITAGNLPELLREDMTGTVEIYANSLVQMKEGTLWRLERDGFLPETGIYEAVGKGYKDIDIPAFAGSLISYLTKYDDMSVPLKTQRQLLAGLIPYEYIEDLAARYDIERNLAQRAAVHRPTDPDALLDRVQAEVPRLMRKYGIEKGLVWYAAVYHPTDPDALLDRVQAEVPRLMGKYVIEKGIAQHAAVNYRDPDGFLDRVQAAVPRLMRKYGIEEGLAQRAAVHHPTDPEALLDRVLAEVPRLMRKYGIEKSLAQHAAVYYPKDPDAFIDRVLEAVSRLMRKYGIEEGLARHAAVHYPKDPDAFLDNAIRVVAPSLARTCGVALSRARQAAVRCPSRPLEYLFGEEVPASMCVEEGPSGPMGGGLNAEQLAEFAASGTPEELAGYFRGEPGLFAEQVGIVRDELRKRGGTFLSRFDELVAPVRESAEARRNKEGQKPVPVNIAGLGGRGSGQPLTGRLLYALKMLKSRPGLISAAVIAVIFSTAFWWQFTGSEEETKGSGEETPRDEVSNVINASELTVRDGVDLFRQGKYEEALELFRALEAGQKGSLPELYYFMGLTYGKLGKDEDACECLKEASRIVEKGEMSHRILGAAAISCYFTGRFEQAERFLERLKGDSGLTDIHRQLKDTIAKAKRTVESLPDIIRDLGYEGRPAGFILAEVKKLLLRGGLVQISLGFESEDPAVRMKAYEYFVRKIRERVVDADIKPFRPPPVIREIVNGLAGRDVFADLESCGLSEAGKRDEFTQLISCTSVSQLTYILLRSMNVEVCSGSSRGHAFPYLDMGDSRIVFVDAVGCGVKEMNLGERFHKRGDYWLLELEDIKPEDRLWEYIYAGPPQGFSSSVKERIGVFYARAGETQIAVKLFREAREIDPGRATIWANMASTEGNLGRKEFAESLFMRAVLLNPNYGHAHLALGLRYIEKRDYLRARLHLMKAAILAPEDPRPRRHLESLPAFPEPGPPRPDILQEIPGRGPPEPPQQPSRGYSGLENEVYSSAVRTAVENGIFCAVSIDGDGRARAGDLVLDGGGERTGNIVLDDSQIGAFTEAVRQFDEDDMIEFEGAVVLFIPGLDDAVREQHAARERPGEPSQAPQDSCYGTHYGIQRNQFYVDLRHLEDPAILSRHLRHEIRERAIVLSRLQPRERVIPSAQRDDALRDRINRLSQVAHQRILQVQEPAPGRQHAGGKYEIPRKPDVVSKEPMDKIETLIRYFYQVFDLICSLDAGECWVAREGCSPLRKKYKEWSTHLLSDRVNNVCGCCELLRSGISRTSWLQVLGTELEQLYRAFEAVKSMERVRARIDDIVLGGGETEDNPIPSSGMFNFFMKRLYSGGNADHNARVVREVTLRMRETLDEVRIVASGIFARDEAVLHVPTGGTGVFLRRSASPGPMGGGLNAYQLAEFAARGTPEELAGYFSGEPWLFDAQAEIVRDVLRGRGPRLLSKFDRLVGQVEDELAGRRQRLSRAIIDGNRRLRALGVGQVSGAGIRRELKEYRGWLQEKLAARIRRRSRRSLPELLKSDIDQTVGIFANALVRMKEGSIRRLERDGFLPEIDVYSSVQTCQGGIDISGLADSLIRMLRRYDRGSIPVKSQQVLLSKLTPYEYILDLMERFKVERSHAQYAVANRPTDPEGFLEDALQKVDRFMQDYGIGFGFAWHVAVHYQEDPGGFIRNALRLAGELEEEFGVARPIAVRAAYKYTSDPRGYIRRCQRTVGRLMGQYGISRGLASLAAAHRNDGSVDTYVRRVLDVRRRLMDTFGIGQDLATHAAANCSDDPEGFVRQVLADTRRLSADGSEASPVVAGRFALRNRVDPDAALRKRLEESRRLAGKFGISEKLALYAVTRNPDAPENFLKNAIYIVAPRLMREHGIGRDIAVQAAVRNPGTPESYWMRRKRKERAGMPVEAAAPESAPTFRDVVDKTSRNISELLRGSSLPNRPCTVGIVIRASRRDDIDALLAAQFAGVMEKAGARMGLRESIRRGVAKAELNGITYVACVDDGTLSGENKQRLRSFTRGLAAAGNPKKSTFAWVIYDPDRNPEDFLEASRTRDGKDLTSIAHLAGLYGGYPPVSWQLTAGPLFVNLIDSKNDRNADEEGRINALVEAVISSISAMTATSERQWKGLSKSLKNMSAADLALLFNGRGLVIALPDAGVIDIREQRTADKAVALSL